MADLNSDGKPEVIVIHDGIIEVLDGATGAVRVGAGGTRTDQQQAQRQQAQRQRAGARG